MFCPRCSQEQVSEAIRFCSRCGLELDLVSEIVETGRTPKRLVDDSQQIGGFSRRNGLIASLLWLLFFMVFVIPISLIADAHEDLVFLLGMLGFFGTVIIAMVSIFLGIRKKVYANDSYQEKQTSKGVFGTNPDAKILAEGKTQPASDFVSSSTPGHSYETGKVAQPSSVTEETTKLLEKEL